MSHELRELVSCQRKLKYRSIRAAATAGEVSNTRWGDFEKGKIGVTDAVRHGVAKAFGWSDDWPENPPAPPDAAGVLNHPSRADLAAQIDGAVARILAAVMTAADADRVVADAVGRVIGELQRAAQSTTEGLMDVRDRLEALERFAEDCERQPPTGRQRRSALRTPRTTPKP